MVCDNKQTVPQVGKNPTTGSDRVEVPVAGAGPIDFGEGQSRVAEIPSQEGRAL